MAKTNMRRLNARQLIKDMGGQAELHRKLNAHAPQDHPRISLKGIEKWCERGTIPGHWLTEILSIAQRDKLPITDQLDSYLPARKRAAASSATK